MKILTLSSELLKGIDTLNTIQGGTVEPRVQLSQTAEFRQIKLSVPGVAVENCRAEVHNNQLSVYYLLHLESHAIPMVVYHKAIPYFIDTKAIRAQIESDELVVRLPFNEFANGYHKDLMDSLD
jgi:HSP20 family protein